MKAPLIVSLVLLSAGALAHAQDPVYITDVSPQMRAGKMSPGALRDELDSANEYARLSNLAALNDGAADELRLWLTWATFDPSTNGIATVGYVVTDEDWKVCRIDYAGKSTAPKSGLCEPYSPRATRERIRTDLRRLSAFADFSIDCEIQDGEWVTIDAVSSGKRFVVSAVNPASCDGDAARLVARLLNRVRVPAR
jgi:hypothetical protein